MFFNVFSGARQSAILSRGNRLPISGLRFCLDGEILLDSLASVARRKCDFLEAKSPSGATKIGGGRFRLYKMALLAGRLVVDERRPPKCDFVEAKSPFRSDLLGGRRFRLDEMTLPGEAARRRPPNYSVVEGKSPSGAT